MTCVKSIFGLLMITGFLLLSKNVEAQKFALLDARFKTPIIYTDSVSVGQVSSGYLAVPVQDFDTLFSNLTYLLEMLSKPQRSKMQSFQLLTKSTRIDVSRIPMAYADRYLIILESKNGEVTSRITFSNGDNSNKQVSEKIQRLLKYITTNNSLFSAPKEIHPRLYNVVVVSDK